MTCTKCNNTGQITLSTGAIDGCPTCMKEAERQWNTLDFGTNPTKRKIVLDMCDAAGVEKDRVLVDRRGTKYITHLRGDIMLALHERLHLSIAEISDLLGFRAYNTIQVGIETAIARRAERANLPFKSVRAG